MIKSTQLAIFGLCLGAIKDGYLNNLQATADAFAGGWFHSGNLAVCHPDDYAKIKDRAKDIIISGGASDAHCPFL
jgi:long-subunit acyl-CoA synthetase (AMP-forming)